MSRPPLLDEKNYSYWKSKMIAFLRSVDTKTWKAVLTGWKAPEHANGIVKMEVEWSPAEEELALGNHRALNAIFNGVDPSVFKMISTCVEAKEAWEILQTN